MNQPVYGDIVIKDDKAIFLGSFKTFKVLKYWLSGKKIIRWWMGTDVWTMWCVPVGKNPVKVTIHRIKSHLFNYLVSENWFVSENLMNEIENLTNLKVVKPQVVIHPCNFIEKKKNFLVIGYYMPKMTKFNVWTYGLDVIQIIEKARKNDVFLRYDGKTPVQDFLSLIDLYIRPSRHDGTPRLNLLCELNSIPYCTSRDQREILDFIEKISELS